MLVPTFILTANVYAMYFLHYLVPRSAMLLLLASTAHAYGPYYAREVNNTTMAVAATGSGIGAAAGTVFGSLIPSGGNGPPRSGFSTAISGSKPLSSLASSSVGTGTAGHQGSLTTAQIPAKSSYFFSTDVSAISSSKTSSGPTTQISFPSPIPTSSGATIEPFTIKATDGSDRLTAITWSAVETGSTSTTDRSGHPTIITAPFWTCKDPLCKGTGCLLAIFCSTGGGGTTGFEGFPPPQPPSRPPPKADDDSPSGSASQSPSTTGTSASSSSSSASSTSSSSSSGTCALEITTVADPGPTPAGGSDDGNLRFLRRTLVARGAATVTEIGSCALTRVLKIPSYQSYKGAMNLNNQRNGHGGANGRIYDAIEKWYPENLSTNGDPFNGDKIDRPFKSSDGPGSIDHVWEKSKVGDFLASLLGSNFDCDDLNALCGNKLQDIFDQLPSMDTANVQTGFAAMNRNLNGMKGWMFSQGFAQPVFTELYNSDETVIQGIQRQAIIFNLFNTDSGIQSMHDQANNRVYSAFLALDKYISENTIQRANGRGVLKQEFGPTFRAWYGQLLTDTSTATYTWAAGQVTKIDADPNLSACLRKAINMLQSSPLYGSSKFQIDQSHLSWTVSSITLKRSLLEQRDGTCPTSSPPISSNAQSASPTPSPSPSLSALPTSSPTPSPTPSSSPTPSPSSLSALPTPSTTPSSSPPSPPPPPATVSGPQCAAPSNNPTGGKYCGFKDIHSGDVDDEAAYVFHDLDEKQQSTMNPNSQNHTEVYHGSSNVAYIMNIGWIPGCTTYSSQSASNPTGENGISYSTLLKDAYHNCTDNKGLGGYYDVGCLRYGFYPTRIPGVFGAPPHPQKYWDQGTYCGAP